ncbi:MAG: cadherin domain-containing protein, partial [Proteobacteria bacterium]|nr:cadherin domain-containing protein [Pseudomonadota bacterium]
DSLTYGLSDDAGGLFQIDAATGEISLAGGLDFESAVSHNLTVEVTDAGGLTASQAVTIDVSDTNEAPSLRVTGSLVAEDAAAGAVVGQATGSDPDAGDSLTYALTDDAGGLFQIDAATGEISLAGGLDFETAVSHNLTVEVTDASGLTATQAVTIDVSDTNEAPSLTVTGSLVAEDAAAGIVVGQATGTDPDAGDSLTYSLSDDAGGLFTIDAATGEITLAGGLDFETAASHNLTVEVTDAGGLTASQNLTIDVADVYEDPADEDDAPAIPPGYDYIVLTPGDDVYNAKQGSQYVDALGSDDIVTGGQGSDILFGNDGNDQLFGEQGADQLYGGAGDDILDGGQGADELYGGSGDDTLLGGQGADTLTGGSGSDTLDGGNQNDTLNGGSGNDTLIGGKGDDILNGQSGDDIMDGGAGDDLFLIGSNDGNDVISGGFGSDSIDLSATGGAPGAGWTVVLDTGNQITGQGADYLDLSGESSGIIIFDDGTEIAFEGIEKVTW